jgi:hypothetical protein
MLSTSIDVFVDRSLSILSHAVPTFTALVDAQPDAAELHARWLDPRVADYHAQEKILAAMKAAADRGDSAGVRATVAELERPAAHATAVNAYLRARGLSACA